MPRRSSSTRRSGAPGAIGNAVALVESDLEPTEMLRRLKAIERDFGRRRGRHGARECSISTSPCGAAADFGRDISSVPHSGLDRGAASCSDQLTAIAPAGRCAALLGPAISPSASPESRAATIFRNTVFATATVSRVALRRQQDPVHPWRSGNRLQLDRSGAVLDAIQSVGDDQESSRTEACPEAANAGIEARERVVAPPDASPPSRSSGRRGSL